MEELFLAAAKLMPEEKLLDELTRVLDNYKVFRTKESKTKLTVFVMLLRARFSTEEQDLTEVLKRYAEHKQVHDLFKNKEK